MDLLDPLSTIFNSLLEFSIQLMTNTLQCIATVACELSILNPSEGVSGLELSTMPCSKMTAAKSIDLYHRAAMLSPRRLKSFALHVVSINALLSRDLQDLLSRYIDLKVGLLF